MSFDMNSLGAMAAQLQQRMMEAKAQAELQTAEGQAGGGLVKVIASGAGMIESIHIDEAAYEDKDMVEDLVRAASNDALRKAKELVAASMRQATGGMPLPPGLF
jgi:DNA-binding YbaB/EbfC family protein